MASISLATFLVLLLLLLFHHDVVLLANCLMQSVNIPIEELDITVEEIAELNGGVWEKLENRVRKLASESNVYVCCGPIESSSPKRIGENKVAVPIKFFKVLCMLRKGRWQAIGFVMPNSAIKGSMFDYAVT